VVRSWPPVLYDRTACRRLIKGTTFVMKTNRSEIHWSITKRGRGLGFGKRQRGGDSRISKIETRYSCGPCGRQFLDSCGARDDRLRGMLFPLFFLLATNQVDIPRARLGSLISFHFFSLKQIASASVCVHSWDGCDFGVGSNCCKLMSPQFSSNKSSYGRKLSA
jgi:hypothetical protein